MSIVPTFGNEPKPKNSGFRMLIPHPKSLFDYAVQTAKRQADLPLGYYNEDIFAHMKDTIHEWQLSYWLDSHHILQMLTTDLKANYSPATGSFAELTFDMEFTPEARDTGKIFQPAKQADTILKYLQRKDFQVMFDPTSQPGGPLLLFPNAQIYFDLGYTYPDAAIENIGDTDFSLSVFTPRLNLKDFNHFRQQLQYFAHAASWSVEAIYAVSGKTAPAFDFDLTRIER